MPDYVPKDPLVWRIIGTLPRPLGGLAAIIWVMVLILLFPLYLWGRSRRRSWFVKYMTRQGRILCWADFLARTKQESGSLIVEVGTKRETRFWWAADRILLKAPMQPPKFFEYDAVQCGGSKYHPFARWSYENYLSPQCGKAYLVFPVQADFKADFVNLLFDVDAEVKMRERFPNQDLIILPFYDARYT